MTDIKKLMAKELEKIEEFKRILTPEEITEKREKVDEFYEKNPTETYFDGMRNWIWIKSPKKSEQKREDNMAMNAPTKAVRKDGTPITDRSDNQLYNWWVKFTKGSIKLSFVSAEILKNIGWDNVKLVTGKLKTQYKIGNDYKNSLEEVAKALNVASIDELDEETYGISYSLNVWQVI